MAKKSTCNAISVYKKIRSQQDATAGGGGIGSSNNIIAI